MSCPCLGGDRQLSLALRILVIARQLQLDRSFLVRCASQEPEVDAFQRLYLHLKVRDCDFHVFININAYRRGLRFVAQTHFLSPTYAITCYE